jgi:hypothetical protein
MEKNKTPPLWTEQEKKILKKMWTSGAHINDICSKLNRSSSGVGAKARHMGWKRPRRAPRWGPIKLDHQIITYRHCGLTRQQVADKLGIPLRRVDTRSAVISRRAEARSRRKDNPVRPAGYDSAPTSDKTKDRSCIMCSRMFESTHAGHRICINCKQGATYQETSGVDAWMGVY